MTRDAKALTAIAVCALALTAAGCGSSGSDSASTSGSAYKSTADAGAAASKTTTIATTKTDLGTVLTGAGGKTVYLFEGDKKGGKSTCSGACAAAWPPVTSTAAVKTAGGAEKSMIGTIARSDGSKQVTYNGWPLYYYVDDSAAGDVTGNGVDSFGAEWYALTPSGKAAEDSADGS